MALAIPHRINLRWIVALANIEHDHPTLAIRTDIQDDFVALLNMHRIVLVQIESLDLHVQRKVDSSLPVSIDKLRQADAFNMVGNAWPRIVGRLIEQTKRKGNSERNQENGRHESHQSNRAIGMALRMLL